MQRKIIKSYSKIWKMEHTFYHLFGKKLPMPISLSQLSIGIVAFVLMLPISKLPIISKLGSFFNLIMIPCLVAWMFSNKLMDGKNVFQYLRSIIYHQFIIIFKGNRIRRFKYCKKKKRKQIANFTNYVFYRENIEIEK